MMEWLGLEELHFLRPWFLASLPLVAAVLWFGHKSRQQQNHLKDFCDPHLLSALMDADGGPIEQRKHRLSHLAVFVLFSVLAFGLAGPAWDKQDIPLLEPQNARVVVLGLARSMRQTDLAPSRFARAKFKTRDLIRSSPALLQALVIYADDAFVVSPLSDDHNTLLNLLKAIELDTVPVAGNRADKGLDLAAQLLDQASLTYREVVLIADTASPLSLNAAQRLNNAGIKVSVLSVNHAASANAAVLKAIANTGDGAFAPLQADGADIARMNAKLRRSSLLNFQQRQQSQNQFTAQEYADQGVWLLLIALLMAAFWFRKGWLLSVVFLSFSLAPPPVYAFKWQDLWQRQDQQAAELYQQKQFADAQLKDTPKWQGAAAYRERDYAAAIDFLQDATDPESLYNLGNAYAQTGELELALAAYDAAIEANPDYSDALYNRDIVNTMLEQQDSQEQQSGDEGDEGEGDEGEGAEGEGDEGEGAEGEGAEGEGAEGEGAEGEGAEGEGAEGEGAEGEGAEGDTEDGEEGEQGEGNAQDEGDESEAEPQQSAAAEPLKSEDQQALEQWLRKLPDNPGTLLKRKFAKQHKQRQQQQQ